MNFKQFFYNPSVYFLSVACGSAIVSENEVLELPPFPIFAGESESSKQWTFAPFDEDKLERFQVDALADISGLAPNLFVSSSDSRGFGDILLLRGQGNTLFFSPPGVAVYVDGVPGGDVFSYSPELQGGSDYTIHRGAQGSRFGRNGPAGVIEIESRQPGAEVEAGASVAYGSYESFGLNAFVATPWGDSGFAHTVDFYYQEREGYVFNTTLGREDDDREAVGGQWSLFWEPNENWSVRFKAQAERFDDGASRLTSLFSADPFTVASDVAGQTEIERYQFSFHVTRHFDWGSFQSITARQFWDLDPSVTDLDLGAVVAQASTSTIVQDQLLWTQEFRLQSLEAADGLQWRAGLFYSNEENNGDSTRVFPAPPFFPVFTERTLHQIDEESLSAYVHLEQELSDVWAVDGGARLEYVDTSLTRSKTSNVGVFPVVATQDSVLVSADLGMRYDVTEHYSVYGRSALSQKASGHSAFTDDPALATFGEETAWSNEIGLSYRSEDDSLGWTLTAFITDIDDYQLERSVPNSTDFIVVNADEVLAWGVEAELAWSPFENFLWEASAGYNKVEFRSHRDGAGNDVSGNEVPFVPEFTLRSAWTYVWDSGFFAQANVLGVGETQYDEGNASLFEQDAYWVLGAQVGYRSEHYTITVYGENLSDEDYSTFINPQIFAQSPGAPQVFGIRLDWAL